MTYVNFELGTRGAVSTRKDGRVSHEKLVYIASQTQPIPARIVFRILKAIRTGVG